MELAPFLAVARPHVHRRPLRVGRASAASCCRAARAGTAAAGAGAARTSLGVDVVTADGELVHADEDENADLLLGRARRRPRRSSASSRASTCARIRCTPMFHDTWMFRLDDLEPLLEWLHEVLPTLDVAVEPVIAATRLRTGERRAAAAHDARRRRRRGGRPAARAARRVPGRSAVEHERGPTTIAEENAAQALQNPEGHRYAPTASGRTPAPRAGPAAARRSTSELPTGTRSRSGTAGRRPASCPTWRSRSRRNVYLATYAIWTDPAEDERHRVWVHGHHARLAEQVGEGVYVGDSDFTRRPDRFLLEDNAQPPRGDPRAARPRRPLRAIRL